MQLPEVAFITFLALQVAGSLGALARSAHIVIRAARETTVSRLLPYPIISTSPAGRTHLERACTWFGVSLSVLAGPWVLALIAYAIVSPAPPPEDMRLFNVVVFDPEGQAIHVRTVHGFGTCQDDAFLHALSRGWAEWSYTCCLREAPSECHTSEDL